jgi:hypothetical protein
MRQRVDIELFNTQDIRIYTTNTTLMTESQEKFINELQAKYRVRVNTEGIDSLTAHIKIARILADIKSGKVKHR